MAGWLVGRPWSRADGESGPTRRSLAPSSSATRSRSTSTSPSLRTVESASALCLPQSSNSVSAVHRCSSAFLAWVPPAQPLAADRRDPPVLLSLLLSARYRTVIEQR